MVSSSLYQATGVDYVTLEEVTALLAEADITSNPASTTTYVTCIDADGNIIRVLLEDISMAGNPIANPSVTLSLDTSIYASGDLLADTQEIASALPSVTGSVLQSLVVIDKDDVGAAFDIYILSENVSLGTENSAPSITDANASKILAIIPVTTLDYKDLGGCKVAAFDNLGRGLSVPLGTSLYVAVVNGTGTPTYTASGIVLNLGLV